MDWQDMATAPKTVRGKRQGPLLELKLPGGRVVMGCHVAPRRSPPGEDCPTWGGWQRVEKAGGDSEPMNDQLGLQPEGWRTL
jgi:hypothetical protein